MAGALLLLVGMAALDVVRAGTAGAWRALAFVVLTGTSAVLMSTLPEVVWQISDPGLLLPAKLVLGPLSGAMTLTYLGVWLGLGADDRRIKSVLSGAAVLALLGGVAILWAHYTLGAATAAQLLLASGALTVMACMVGCAVNVHCTLQGDKLAAWMAWSSLCLACAIMGLYAKSLQWPAGNWVWFATAVLSVVFFVTSTSMTLLRNSQQKKLQRVASGNHACDPVTGLTTGSVLLTKVDHAMWRGARASADSAIVAIWVNNLYALNEEAGQDIEHEIRTRLTAVVRQTVGFRNVVGLMQARCYVIAVAIVQDSAQLDRMAQRLLKALHRPMRVGFLIGQAHMYVPQVGIGMVLVPSSQHGHSLAAMDAAQRLAQKAYLLPDKVLAQQGVNISPINTSVSRQAAD